MDCQLSVPSKTFMLGEYLVLKGGPALVLTTNPRFVLNVSQKKEGASHLFEAIHAESPAGKFIARHLHFYQKYALNFVDPYHGIGGLGASSAQFVLVYALKMQMQKFVYADLLSALKTYRDIAWDGGGIAPSGADVISQLNGGICLFHPTNQMIARLDWPFTSFEYCLVHTSNKIMTHNHLKTLQNIDVSELEKITQDAVMSIEKKDDELFMECIRKYGESLQKKQLVLAETLMLLNQIQSQSGVLAAKGCGALGADVIFVLLDRKNRQSFTSWCAKQKLRIIGLGQEISEGFKWSSPQH